MFGSAAKARNKNLEIYRDITDDVEESDFVPYACFYDQHTIITKNGEVCQTIKVTGLARDNVAGEASSEDSQDLRGLIRDSLKKHVPNDSFAIWLHTLRKQTDLSPSGEFEPETFSGNVNDAWLECNNFAQQFVNEVYITIVHEGQDARLRHVKNLFSGMIPSKEVKWRQDHIDGICGVLNNTVERILNDLKEYGAYRLGMYKENGVYYSEQLRFLEKIINFVDRPMPVVEVDLSTYLTTGEITFSFNAMEVRTPDNKRRFASLLTLKEYKESSLPVIDQFLQLPVEFIVTQTINFVNPQKVLHEYQEVANYQRLSEDPDISRISELTNILNSNRNNPNDFGEQQLTVFILSDTVALLEENVKKSINFFARYGIIFIREDIKFEETYWAQLPGNFIFASRMKPTYTSHVAGFANLHNMPVGQANHNHWGNAVTTFHTATGTPYYFNFHVGNVGHTLVVGPPDSGKIVMTNFLITQAMKFKPKIFYLDVFNRSSYLIKSLGGVSYDVTSNRGDNAGAVQPLFNPFSCRDTPENKQFLTRWLGVLARASGYQPTDADKQAIANAVVETYNKPEAERHLMQCIETLRTTSPEYVQAISQWIVGGKYGHVFTARQSVLSTEQTILGLNLREAIKDAGLNAVLISFLLQRILDALDGSPTILVIEESWQLLSQTQFGADIAGFLQALTDKNALLMSISETIEGSGQTPVTAALAQGSVTQIYMPDDDPCDEYQTVFGLDDTAFSYLDVMEREARHFLMKRGSEVVVGEMDLSGLSDYFNVLAGRRAG